jgi:hypothetical protein
MRIRRIPHRWIIMAAVLIALIIVASVAALFFADEPLRRYTEAKMNAPLKGYTVNIRALHFSPITFSLDLRDTIIVQNEHPDPPVANIERLYASVHWGALLSGRVVGDVLIDHPIVVLNLEQIKREIIDPTRVRDRGWQDALQAIYPLKINELRILRGDVTYRDTGPFKPLHLHDLEFRASNIRNLHSEQGAYPSPMSLQARVFDAGSVTASGWADFLAEPYAAFSADIKLDTVELDYFKPITNRYHLVVDKGTLSAAGQVEIAPQYKTAKLWQATVDGVRVDYIHTAAASLAEHGAAARTAQAAQSASTDAGMMLRIDRLDVVKSTVGFTNRATNPEYRVFLADTTLTITNLSSIHSGETAVAHIRGQFMGTGPTTVDFKLHPERPGPDFDLAVRIDDTALPAMNDLLRAYGKFDVVAGRFALYSEMAVKNRQISGYVKPLFRDVVVYDPRKDRDKTVFQKMYEGAVNIAARVLQNRPRSEVVTRVEISGQLDKPNVSIIDIISGVVQNAFFNAILPGFETHPSRALNRGA